MSRQNRFLSLSLVLSLFIGGAQAQTDQQQTDQSASAESTSATAAAEFYEKALIAHNLGEMREALIYLRNALKEDPLLLPAHLLLGKVYLSLGEGEKAEKQLLIADGLGAHRSLIQNSLARAYLMQGRPQQLIDELFPMGASATEDAELLALRGEALLELDQVFDAQRAFSQAWEMNPRSVAAILGRVRLLLMDGEVEQATALARNAVEIAPTNARAWYLKGALSNALGDLVGALSDYEKATELLPTYLPAQIGRLGVLLRLNRLEQAEDVAAQVRETYPNDPRSHYLVAVVEIRLDRPESAEAALVDAYNLITRFPRELIESHRPTLLMAGIVSFNLKQWTQARDYLELFLSQEPESAGARVLLARLEMEGHNRPERAIQLLEEAVQRSPGNKQALSFLTEAYMETSQHLKAAQTLRRAMEQHGNDLILRTQQAVNEFGLGRRSMAIEQLSSVFERRPDLSAAGATLTVMQLQEREYQAAVDSARVLLLREPENLSYVNLFGAALFAAGQLDAAQWAFELALAMDPDFFPARLNLAELLLRRGDTRLARSHLERILDYRAEEISALTLLARTYEADGDLEQALRLSQQALGIDPGSVDAAVQQVDLLLRLGEPEEAVRIAEAAEVRTDNPDDVDFLSALSRAYIASGRRATAQTVLRRSSGLAGYDARKLLEVAHLQREAGDLEGALWSLQKAADGDPQFLPARMQHAEMLIELDRLVEAVAAVESLAKDFPQAPYADHLMGLVHRARGEDQAALESFRAAFRKEPSSLLATRVYQAMVATEGLEPAAAFLEQWVAANPDDGFVGQVLAQAYHQLGRTSQAVELFEKTLAQSPDNPLLLNNLALAYADSGDARALDHARRAYELRPGAPEIADTLGWVLVKQGEVLEGLRHLRDAQSRAATDAGISYHIAVALSELGRTDEAIDELVRAMRSAAGSAWEQERAARLLQELRAAPRG